jgi:hypothetical protein
MRQRPQDRGNDGRFLPLAGVGSPKLRAVFFDKRTKEYKAIQLIMNHLIELSGGQANVTNQQREILRRIRKYAIDMYMYEKWLYNQVGMVNGKGEVPAMQTSYAQAEKRYSDLVDRFTSLIVDEKSDYQKVLDAMAKERDNDQHKGSEKVG